MTAFYKSLNRKFTDIVEAS